MVNIHANGNKVAYGIKHFDLDTFADLVNINVKALTLGSTAFIIDASKYYMLNGQRKWIKINPYGMSDSSSFDDNINPEDSVIYEGGVV